MDTGALTVRAAGPADVAALRGFVRGLSPLTRARRFFVPVPDLPQMLVDALSSSDPQHRFLLAEIDDDSRPSDDTAGCIPLRGRGVVGLAQYARSAQALQVCDIALVVADGWQKHGIGRTLLQRLLAEARSQGIALAVGDVLRQNRPMLGLARQAGFSVQADPEDARIVRIARTLLVQDLSDVAIAA